MEIKDKIIAIIPAKSNSKRIANKNIVELAGKPLLAYTIKAAIKSNIFERVIVSTDSEEIAAIARNYGAESFIRDKELAKDTSTVAEVCINVLDSFREKGEDYKVVCTLLPTNPLRDAEDIKNAFELFVKNPDANYVMAVTQYEISPYWALKEENGFLKLAFGDQYLTQNQNLPEAWVDNGAIFIAKTNVFRREKKLFGTKTIPYKMPRQRSVDVDEPEDLELAEFFIKKRKWKK